VLVRNFVLSKMFVYVAWPKKLNYLCFGPNSTFIQLMKQTVQFTKVRSFDCSSSDHCRLVSAVVSCSGCSPQPLTKSEN